MSAQAGIGRRALLRSGMLASAGAAGGLWLTACGPAAQQAAPQQGPAPTELVLAPWGGWPAYGGPHWAEFVAPAMDAFHQKNPGIKVTVVAPGGGGSFLPAILAGTAPDVFQDWAIAQYRSGNLVVNLDRYIRQDNLDYGLWSPGQMNAMRDGEGTWFLPCYVHVDTMAVNLSILDALGLQYPSPDWTHTEAAQLFRAASTTKGGKRQFGVSLKFQGNSMGDPNSTSSYVYHLFGGSMVDATRTKAAVGDPKSYAGVQWLDQLYWDKVATSGSSDLGTVPFCEVGSNALVTYLKAWRDNFKWMFIPEPHFPAGQYSFEATDYYAINAQTKHPDESWILLRYLCAEPEWSRWCMKYLLRTPSIVSLWEEYVTTVEAVAPLVHNKGMEQFTAAASKWGVANKIFKYGHVNAVNTLNTQLGKAFSQQASVPLAMTSAAGQIDALEQAGAQEQTATTAMAKAFPAANGQQIAAVLPGL
ncbi:MAG TPA: extracellular solute-binding protein [Bacillota bacterium]|nr:extracellular solute-binding protein [Bacillota bacterium]